MITISCQQFVFNTANDHYILSAVCFHNNWSPSSTVLVCTTKNTCGRKSAIIVTITFSWITFNTRSVISTQKLLWWESGVASQRERERKAGYIHRAAPPSQTMSWITKHLCNYSTILQRTFFLLLLHCHGFLNLLKPCSIQHLSALLDLGKMPSSLPLRVRRKGQGVTAPKVGLEPAISPSLIPNPVNNS